jgi:hypothetical protein
VLRVAPLLSELRRVAGRRPLPVSLDAIASPGRRVFVDPIERGPLLGEKKRVLILCTHNSVRSQMGEGLLRSAHLSSSLASRTLRGIPALPLLPTSYFKWRKNFAPASRFRRLT